MLPYAKASSDIYAFYVLLHLILPNYDGGQVNTLIIRKLRQKERLANMPKVTHFERLELKPKRSDPGPAPFTASQNPASVQCQG